MSLDHNRIKVADLEKGDPNKILITNSDGELTFSDMDNPSLQAVTNVGSITTNGVTVGQIIVQDGLQPPSDLNAVQIENDTPYNCYVAYGHTHTYRVYAYKIVDLIKIYSKTYSEFVFLDDDSKSFFYTINVTWTASSGADGYKVIKYSNFNPVLNFNFSLNVVTTSFNDSSNTHFTEDVVVVPNVSPVNSISGTLSLPYETASTIASFDASKNIKSLSTATYPSLTELSYGKGVTSSIQTQLNGKQNTITNPVTGTGTEFRIPFWGSSSSLSDDSAFIWDSTNKRIGLGTPNPLGSFHILAANHLAVIIQRTGTITGRYNLGIATSTNSFAISDHAQGGLTRLLINGSGNVGLGTITPSEKLHVNGYALASGYKTPGGLSSGFLKADGSIDSRAYALTSGNPSTPTLQQVASAGNTTTLPISLTLSGGDGGRKGVNSSNTDINYAGYYTGVGIRGEGATGVQGFGLGYFGVGLYGYSIEYHGIYGESETGTAGVFNNTGGGRIAEFQSNYSGKVWIDESGVTVNGGFIKLGGTPTQFLKADGSVDSSAYVTSDSITGKENLSNKQNSLAFDVTNTKYPTVTAVKNAVVGYTPGVGMTSSSEFSPDTKVGFKNDGTVEIYSQGSTGEFGSWLNIGLGGIVLGNQNSLAGYYNSMSIDHEKTIFDSLVFAPSYGFKNVDTYGSFHYSYLQIPLDGNGGGEPAGDFIWTLPPATGTLALTSDLPSLSAYALDAEVVHKTGNETIAGIKNFTSSPLISTGSLKLEDTDLSGDIMTIYANANKWQFSNTFGEKLLDFNNSAISFYKTNAIKADILSGSLTASRNYTLPDASGTLALTSDLSTKADNNSPALTGVPTAPTATLGTNTSQIATTAFVQELQKIIVRKISTAITLADSDNATVILLTASCTVTLPSGLMSGFNCSFATQSGATLTYSLGGSVVLINNSGTTMPPLSSHTLVNTGTTNEYLTVGL